MEERLGALCEWVIIVLWKSKSVGLFYDILCLTALHSFGLDFHALVRLFAQNRSVHNSLPNTPGIEHTTTANRISTFSFFTV